MDGIKECYRIIGAIAISLSAMIYTMRMDTVGVIILLIGNIAGQVLFKEAYNK
jgi:hypothetical protein